MEGSIYDYDDIKLNINKQENSKITLKKKQLLHLKDEFNKVVCRVNCSKK